MNWRYTLYASIVPVCAYFAFPFTVLAFPHFMQHLFFLNFVRVPDADYQNLKKHGLYGRSFYLEVEDKQCGKNPVLGVWHILPKSIHVPEGEILTEERSKQVVRENQHGILIYLHGNSLDRTYSPRCELYRMLSQHDLHVLTIDYRGYGDSTGKPTEDGVVADAKAIYDYALKLDPMKPIFIWGHSMGSGVATRTVAELTDMGIGPTALVLEAPFNNLPDVIRYHPFSAPFRFLPWFNFTVIRSLMRSGLLMHSDHHIKRIDCPVLVLHAQDDPIIPVSLGRKLVKSAKDSKRDITYIEFDASRLFLHSFIYKAEELSKIITDFFDVTDKKRRTSS